MAPQFSFAIYRFELLAPDDRPNVLSLDLAEASLPPQYWAAIADYNSMRWQVLPVTAPNGLDNFGFDEAWQPISPGGNLYAAIILGADTAAVLEQVSLTLGTAAPPPGNVQASDGNGGNVAG